MTRRTSTIDAHALGVSIPDENAMDALLKLDRERLIERHHAQVKRIYAGITQRAMEHQGEISRLEKRVTELRGERDALSRKINWTFLALSFCAGLVLYFAVKDQACPVLPWIARITQ